MLKLKRVEVQGFKSFYDRTEMRFNGTGIAAIVGPNGCGKSNLSDAISWVLGEQSAKSLRGARMEDVIFAGTRDRKPLGLASVTMTLIPDQERFELISGGAGEAASLNEHVQTNGRTIHGPLRTEAAKTAERRGEITITRRLYRSGESEYLMNGKLARLRDIQDLFLGTGLGPESYAIIEQGRIGQILSNRPQDRRNVIEEAAGITKFKTRKRLAEGKLESAKQNLARVFDILEEVTRQVNSLKRQAAKTKRYSELKAEARTYLRQLLAAKFRMLEREAARLAIELNLASAELQNLKGEIAQREQNQATIGEASHANEQKLTQARTVVSDLHLEAERTRGRLEYQTKEIQRIEQHLTLGQEEVKALDEKWQKGAAELEQQKSELAALEAQCAQARQRLEAKSTERRDRQTSLSEGQHAVEAVRQKLLRLMSESSTLRNRITHAEAQMGSIDRQMARARTEEQQDEASLARIETLRGELSLSLATHQNQLNSVTEQRKRAEEELRQKRAQLNESGQALERLRAEFSRVKARQDSIEEVLEHRSSHDRNGEALFYRGGTRKRTRAAAGWGACGFPQVDPQLEKSSEEQFLLTTRICRGSATGGKRSVASR